MADGTLAEAIKQFVASWEVSRRTPARVTPDSAAARRRGVRLAPEPAHRETGSSPFEGWAILELMGHRRLAGRLSEHQIGGAAFVRIDIPGAPGEPEITQLYSPSAVYCITPSTEETARTVAALGRPAPVQRWELPAAPESDELPY